MAISIVDLDRPITSTAVSEVEQWLSERPPFIILPPHRTSELMDVAAPTVRRQA